MSVVCVELCGSSKVTRWDSNLRCLPTRDDAHAYGWAQKCLMLFLPEGYPESVPNDYMAYQVWLFSERPDGVWAITVCQLYTQIKINLSSVANMCPTYIQSKHTPATSNGHTFSVLLSSRVVGQTILSASLCA